MAKNNQNHQDSCWKNWLKKHFCYPRNTRQILVDLLFGVAAPILCLWFDPLVFRTSMMCGPYLNNMQIFAYVTIPVGVVFFLFNLFYPLQRSPVYQAVLGCLMVFGSMFALAIGLILLPLSILAILAVRWEGLLCLIPFLTAFVFFRAGLRALRSGWQKEKRFTIIASTLISICLVIGVPALLQYRANDFITSAVADITFGEEWEAALATERLQQVFWCSDSLCYDHLVWAYHDWYLEHGTEALWIASAYQELTGKDIDDRLWITGLHAFLR